MSRVRIVCRMPPPVTTLGMRIQTMPSVVDCDVSLVDDDGTERPIDGVTSVEWRVGLNECAEAVVKIAGVELDVESILARRADTP